MCYAGEHVNRPISILSNENAHIIQVIRVRFSNWLSHGTPDDIHMFFGTEPTLTQNWKYLDKTGTWCDSANGCKTYFLPSGCSTQILGIRHLLELLTNFSKINYKKYICYFYFGVCLGFQSLRCTLAFCKSIITLFYSTLSRQHLLIIGPPICSLCDVATFSATAFYKGGRVWSKNLVHHSGVVGRVSVFQPLDPSSIPGGVRNFNLYPGTRCVFLVCVLFCVVSGGGPDILLTTDFRDDGPYVHV